MSRVRSRTRYCQLLVFTPLLLASLACSKKKESPAEPPVTKAQDQLRAIEAKARAYFDSDTKHTQRAPLVEGIGAVTMKTGAAKEGPSLPPDVQVFIETRRMCDHWRGEEPYDEERAAEIEREAGKTCTGTDAQLALLRSSYADNAEVIAALADFEDRVE